MIAHETTTIARLEPGDRVRFGPLVRHHDGGAMLGGSAFERTVTAVVKDGRYVRLEYADGTYSYAGGATKIRRMIGDRCSAHEGGIRMTDAPGRCDRYDYETRCAWATDGGGV